MFLSIYKYLQSKIWFILLLFFISPGMLNALGIIHLAGKKSDIKYRALTEGYLDTYAKEFSDFLNDNPKVIAINVQRVETVGLKHYYTYVWSTDEILLDSPIGFQRSPEPMLALKSNYFETGLCYYEEYLNKKIKHRLTCPILGEGYQLRGVVSLYLDETFNIKEAQDLTYTLRALTYEIEIKTKSEQ